MHRKIMSFALLISLLLISSHASATKIKSSWKNPKATAESFQLKKVLVVALIKQDFTRKVAEDKAAAIINKNGRAKATASYTFLSVDDLNDKEAVKTKIGEMGFDGVVLMHSAGSKDQQKYDDTEHAGDWYPYYDFYAYYYVAWGSVYNVMTTNDLYVYIETMFYSLKENQLLWSCITETRNPKNPAKVVEEIAEDSTNELEKAGLLQKK